MSKWSVVWEASLVRVTRRQSNLWQSVQLDYQREVLTQELKKKKLIKSHMKMQAKPFHPSTDPNMKNKMKSTRQHSTRYLLHRPAGKLAIPCTPRPRIARRPRARPAWQHRGQKPGPGRQKAALTGSGGVRRT